ncbi:uncharacterized protein DNG_03667 [Cephalotrichum gorgonifer]|uniref:Uncharacterized protein n=1 Tax=Cephalotrichum gorgonifer TaxID=2041049 RepID=A0AAE8MUM3_9PEZI|nr:uncharacterized protein DNG_03667 [Cephalotrichum gorgonifer]
MAPAVSPGGSFHRSHSTPELYALANPDSSLSTLSFEIPSFQSSLNFDTRLSFGAEELDLSLPKDTAETNAASVTAEPVVADLDERPKLGRSNTISGRTRSWLPGSKSASNVRDLLTAFTTSPSGKDNVSPKDSQISKPHGTQETSQLTRSESVSGFGRSRKSQAQDPSSSLRASVDSSDVPTLPQDKGPRKGYSRFSKPGGKDQSSRPSDSVPSLPKAKSRTSSYFSIMNQRPATVFGKLGLGSDSDSSDASSSTSLALPTNTTDTIPSNPTSISDLNSSTDSSSLDVPSRGCERDPLSSVFKNLDLEVGILEANPTPPSLRMHVVKSTLLPFLQQYTNLASVRLLQPEDIERRAIVLNKWWTVLLDQLGSLGVQPTPGVDRVSLLDALTLLMMRPEWRQVTSYFQPLDARSPNEPLRRRPQNQSAGSPPGSAGVAGSAKSVEQNVRTMFVSNLVRQVELVVDKMSQRNATAGLVNFCGKACAYAFFFAPGVADILVRLWGLDTLLIQRVADEFGLPRRSNGESEDIVALFPPCLGNMGWSSIKTMGSSLRTVPSMSPELAKIRWYSPWIARWRGRDTDLFYIFCKYYHILAEEFMPDGLPLIEKSRAPAFVLVHSQVLAILDTTVHRQAALQAFGAASQLSDGIHGLDTSAAAMPGLPADFFKSMSENRLVALLKDFFSETSPALARARHTYAETFMAIMKAATKRISQFDFGASHTLCDFLEEALVAYDAAEVADDPSTRYVDWEFWFRVCRLISESLNAMTEMRVLCFIYTIWDTATRVPKRKEALCLDWLLSEETFYRLFNHWCPMIRAYYMRLLCWRICRDTGSPRKVDTKIFLAVAARLKTVWAHYLYLQEEADIRGCYAPSTAPCYPTPGKKFMIIRSEVNVPLANMFMGFDTIGKPPNPDELAERISSADPLQSKPDGKKKWSLLGLNKAKSDYKYSGGDDFERGRRAPPPPSKGGKNSSRFGGGTSSPSSESTSRAESPIFEEPRYVFRFVLNWYPPAAMPTVDRVLSRPRLPSPAQSWVSSRRRSIGELPPINPGLPPITRRISGSVQTGLINEAKNASPLSALDTAPRRASMSSSTFSRVTSDRSDSDNSDQPGSCPSLLDRGTTSSPDSETSGNGGTQPIKPCGEFVKSSVYAGRALAEWSIVVHECNNFVERRREEGILGLSDVEVPLLSLETHRRAN